MHLTYCTVGRIWIRSYRNATRGFINFRKRRMVAKGRYFCTNKLEEEAGAWENAIYTIAAPRVLDGASGTLNRADHHGIPGERPKPMRQISFDEENELPVR